MTRFGWLCLADKTNNFCREIPLGIKDAAAAKVIGKLIKWYFVDSDRNDPICRVFPLILSMFEFSVAVTALDN